MTRRRIAFVDHAEELGGAQKSLMELLANLDRNEYELVILHTEGAQWVERPEIADVERLPVFRPARVFGQRRDNLSESLMRSAGSLAQSARPVARLRKAFKKLGVNLAHTNTLKAHMLGSPAARLAGVPLVWHVRDILKPGAARRWLVRAAKWGKPEIVAISGAVAAQFDGEGLAPTIIHNGVPMDRFTPGEPSPDLRRELGLSEDDELLCIVGRLTPWKGHRELLSAMAIVSETRPKARLLVVGEVAFWESGYEEELRNQAESIGLSDRVVWLGFRDDVPDVVRLADVFVLPSHHEPFGRVIIEAMALGKPVVATRSGGVPEIVVDGQTGLLVEPGSVDGLAAALVHLLQDRETATAMGRQGLSRAREQFDARRVARMVQEVYERVLI